MATVDKIRNGLIDKILSINDKDFLVALDSLVASGSSDNEWVKLTTEQKQILKISEEDI